MATPDPSACRLAERDTERGARLQQEFAHVDEALRGFGICSTVVVFGSARVGESAEHPARAQHWYREARRFARIVSECGGALTRRDGLLHNVIASGGGPGIMEAANRGAHDCGAPSVGFNIELPHVQVPNPYSTPELTFHFHYFAMRKMHLALRAAALVVFPGGFGTFDELFEMLTLAQTGKMRSLPILCFDRDFWMRIVNFEAMIQAGLLSRSDVALLTFVDDADEAWSALAKTVLAAP